MVLYHVHGFNITLCSTHGQVHRVKEIVTFYTSTGMPANALSDAREHPFGTLIAMKTIAIWNGYTWQQSL